MCGGFKGTHGGAVSPPGAMCDLICVTASCEYSTSMTLAYTSKCIMWLAFFKFHLQAGKQKKKKTNGENE